MTVDNCRLIDEADEFSAEDLKSWHQDHVAQFRWKAVTGKRRVVPVILGYRLSSASYVLMLNRKDVFFESQDEHEAAKVYKSLSLADAAFLVSTEAGPVMGFAEHDQAIESARMLAPGMGELYVTYFNRQLEKVHAAGAVEVLGTLAGFFVPPKEGVA